MGIVFETLYKVSHSNLISKKSQDVHHSASKTSGCCVCCPKLLSLVHLPPPPLRGHLRGARGGQGLSPRLHVPSYWSSLNLHMISKLRCCFSKLFFLSYFISNPVMMGGKSIFN